MRLKSNQRQGETRFIVRLPVRQIERNEGVDAIVATRAYVAARQRHGQIELLTQHLQNVAGSVFSADRESPEYRAPYKYCPRAISHRFENVGPTPDPAVNVDFDRACHRVDNLR